jgi:uncharacterized protein YfaS (alpha-2-macroglobulin family)
MRAPWFRDRWFLFALATLGVNAAGWYWVGKSAAPPRPGEMANATLRPMDHEAAWAPRALVQVEFDRAVQPAGAGNGWVTNRVLRFQPPMEGALRWPTPDLALFQPERPWPPGATFRVSLDSQQVPARLPEQVIRPRPPTLLGGQAIGQPQPLSRIKLRFDAPLTEEELQRTLVVREHGPDPSRRLRRSDQAKPLTWSLAGGQGTAQPEIALTLPDADLARLEVSFSRGANATAPALVLAPSPDQPLSFLGVEVDDESLRLDFSRPVDAEQARDFLRLEPPVPGLQLQDRNEFRPRLWLNGGFRAGETYTLHLKAGFPARHGQPMEKDQQRVVRLPDLDPDLDFVHAGRHLSTRGRQALALRVVNLPTLEAEARPILAEHLVASLHWEQRRRWWDPEEIFSGGLGPARRTTLRTGATANQPATLAWELAPLLPAGAQGAWLVSVRTPPGTEDESDWRTYRQISRVVGLSDLGLLAKQVGGEMLVWVNRLSSAQPVAGVRVELRSTANRGLGEGRTDAEGLARFPVLATESDQESPLAVLAHGEGEFTFLTLPGSRLDLGAEFGGDAYHRHGYEAFLFSERGVFRPGETVPVQAVVRDARLVPPEPFDLRLRLVRPDGVALPVQSCPLDTLGVAQARFSLDPAHPTGSWQVEARVPGQDTPIGRLAFWVEDFVPPQLAVDITPPAARLPAGTVTAKLQARHLFGGPGAGLAFTARLNLQPQPFASSAWPGYAFVDEDVQEGTRLGEEFRGLTDDSGSAVLRLNPAPREGSPRSSYRAVLHATVREKTGRAVSTSIDLPYDPLPAYVGVQAPAARIGQGEAVTLPVAWVQPAGAPFTARTTLRHRLEREHWRVIQVRQDETSRWENQRERELLAEGTLQLTEGRGKLGVQVHEPGQYVLRVWDPETGAAATWRFRAAPPGDTWQDTAERQPGRVVLTADQPVYTPGKTARVQVQSPHPGRALITLETDRLHRVWTREFSGNTAEVEIPLDAELAPNAYCTVQVVRPHRVGEADGPLRSLGALRLPLQHPERKLAVRLSAPAQARPNEPLSVAVAVDGLDGRPAQVVVAAVDDGIWRLTRHERPDPLAWFTRPRRLMSEHYDLYRQVLPELGAELAALLAAPGGDAMAQLGKRLNPVKVRRFKPVALWQPGLAVDTNGQAEARFTLPEFTGSLRLMAVVVAGEAFGSAEAKVEVKRPLIVQTGLPRFLHSGDQAQGHLWIVNAAAQPVTARWSVTTRLPGPEARAEGEIPLAPGAETTVRFPLRAAPDAVGAGAVEVRVEAGGEVYTETTELALAPGHPHITRTVEGALAAGESVRLSGESVHGFLAPEVSLRADGLPALSWNAAYEALIRYPHGCLEQTLSAAFPLLEAPALFDTLLPGRLTREDAAVRVQQGIGRVLGMQRPDGMFTWWPGDGDPFPYGTAYAVEFLLAARASGYPVPEDSLERAVRRLDQRLDERPRDGDPWITDRLRAYTVSLLAQSGRPREDWLTRLWETRDRLDVYARAHLARALAALGRRPEARQLLESTGSAPSTTQADFDPTLPSDFHLQALLIDAWGHVDPAAPALAAWVKHLGQAHRKWQNTHDQSRALVALGRHLSRQPDARKPFTAFWRPTGSTVRDFSPARPLNITGPDLTAGGELANQGPGQVYYSWQISGVPIGESEPDQEAGLRLRRHWQTMAGQPVDLRDFRAGESYQLLLQIDTLGRALDQLVVEVPLPAGLELENARFVPGGGEGRDRDDAEGARALPLRHLELRDDRALLFTGAFQGQREHRLVARAVTPGDFRLPAAQVSAMYQPSLFSRQGSGRLRVQEAAP